LKFSLYPAIASLQSYKLWNYLKQKKTKKTALESAEERRAHLDKNNERAIAKRKAETEQQITERLRDRAK